MSSSKGPQRAPSPSTPEITVGDSDHEEAGPPRRRGLATCWGRPVLAPGTWTPSLQNQRNNCVWSVGHPSGLGQQAPLAPGLQDVAVSSGHRGLEASDSHTCCSDGPSPRTASTLGEFPKGSEQCVALSSPALGVGTPLLPCDKPTLPAQSQEQREMALVQRGGPGLRSDPPESRRGNKTK